ncbi:MAG: hypothetical protein Q4D98_06635 [Planctomycetia bacterium]|nr:hypothetical protein [Planctomycetia bacterium]
MQQFLLTHCTYGTSALERKTGEIASHPLGYSVRSASVSGGALREAFRKLERYVSYYLPYDTPAEEKEFLLPQMAPTRLVSLPVTDMGSVLLRIVYRPKDTAGRVGSYFAHGVTSDTKGAWDMERVLGLWGATGWVQEDSEYLEYDLPELEQVEDLREGEAPVLNERAFQAFLDGEAVDMLPKRWEAVPKARRREMFRTVLAGFLGVRDTREEAFLLVAEPEAAALLFYGISLFFPRTLTRGISFSTYEAQPERWMTKLAATTFSDAEGKDVAEEIYHGRMFVLNTFNGRCSAEKVPEFPFASQVWAQYEENGLAGVRTLCRNLESIGVATAADVNAMATVEEICKKTLEPGGVVSGTESAIPKTLATSRAAMAFWKRRLQERLGKVTSPQRELEPILGSLGHSRILELLGTGGDSPELQPVMQFLISRMSDAQYPSWLANAPVKDEIKARVLERKIRQTGNLPEGCAFLWKMGEGKTLVLPLTLLKLELPVLVALYQKCKAEHAMEFPMLLADGVSFAMDRMGAVNEMVSQARERLDQFVETLPPETFNAIRATYGTDFFVNYPGDPERLDACVPAVAPIPDEPKAEVPPPPPPRASKKIGNSRKNRQKMLLVVLGGVCLGLLMVLLFLLVMLGGSSSPSESPAPVTAPQPQQESEQEPETPPVVPKKPKKKTVQEEIPIENEPEEVAVEPEPEATEEVSRGTERLYPETPEETLTTWDRQYARVPAGVLATFEVEPAERGVRTTQDVVTVAEIQRKYASGLALHGGYVLFEGTAFPFGLLPEGITRPGDQALSNAPATTEEENYVLKDEELSENAMGGATWNPADSPEISGRRYDLPELAKKLGFAAVLVEKTQDAEGLIWVTVTPRIRRLSSKESERQKAEREAVADLEKEQRTLKSAISTCRSASRQEDPKKKREAFTKLVAFLPMRDVEIPSEEKPIRASFATQNLYLAAKEAYQQKMESLDKMYTDLLARAEEVYDRRQEDLDQRKDGISETDDEPTPEQQRNMERLAAGISRLTAVFTRDGGFGMKGASSPFTMSEEKGETPEPAEKPKSGSGPFREKKPTPEPEEEMEENDPFAAEDMEEVTGQESPYGDLPEGCSPIKIFWELDAAKPASSRQLGKEMALLSLRVKPQKKSGKALLDAFKIDAVVVLRVDGAEKRVTLEDIGNSRATRNQKLFHGTEQVAIAVSFSRKNADGTTELPAFQSDWYTLRPIEEQRKYNVTLGIDTQSFQE